MSRRPIPITLLIALTLAVWPRTALLGSQTPPSPPTGGAHTIPIDLASATDIDVPIDTGTYSVEVFNLAPMYLSAASAGKGRYSFTVHVVSGLLPELIFPTPATAKAGGESIAPVSPCTEDLALLKKATTETEVKTLRDKLSKEADKNISADCKAFQDIDSQLDVVLGTWKIHPGDVLTVTISRGVGDNAKTWTQKYTAAPIGDWLTSYGFMFIPDHNQEFFSKATSDPKMFVITQKVDRNGYAFAPSVFFTFLPSADHTCAVLPGVSAGLGFDLTAPTVFLGASLLYRQNLQLVGGVVMHQETRLNGQYHNGQTIGENLSNDQLTDKSYRARAFVGLSFRFSTNPFHSSGPTATATPSPGKADKTKAPTPGDAKTPSPGGDKKGGNQP